MAERRGQGKVVQGLAGQGLGLYPPPPQDLTRVLRGALQWPPREDGEGLEQVQADDDGGGVGGRRPGRDFKLIQPRRF